MNDFNKDPEISELTREYLRKFDVFLVADAVAERMEARAEMQQLIAELRG